MIAIQIKYLSATNTKCARLKVWAEGKKPVVYSTSQFCTNSVKSIELQAAIKFASDLGLLNGGRLDLVIGQLPNLDHCAIFVENS